MCSLECAATIDREREVQRPGQAHNPLIPGRPHTNVLILVTMTDIKFHAIEGLPRSMSPSSHASEADGFVFLTGQFGRDLDDPNKPLPDGIRAQTDRTMGNLVRVLGALDLTLGNVLSVRVFLTNFKRDYEAMNEVYGGVFTGDRRPVRTCVGVTDLVRDALIELDCVAKR
jgi:2-iminobutanoate/2-iminopropanoate deaminase